MFKRQNSQVNSRDGIDRILDSVEANSHRWHKAKPFFPTLTKFLLILGLGFLSWLATYTGILELIIANSGDMSFSYRIAIAFAVAMLMLMIIYLLDSLFSPLRWWLRLLYLTGYLFLTLISVGFGFGFYWKFLESRAEATRSAESAVGQVQTSLQTGQTRLEQLLTTLTTLTALSKQKAEQERTKGGTCPSSPPGDGPRRRLRDADAKNFQFAGDFVGQRVGTVKADIEALNLDMAKIVSRDSSTVDPVSGTRNKFLRGMSRKLDGTIARFNAFRTDPQLKQFRQSFAERSTRTVFSNGKGGTFSCPDPQLQTALRGVVRAIDELPDLSKPQIAAVEGSEAIVEAFRRLTTTTIGLMSFKLPPSPDELRSLQQKAVQSVKNPEQIQTLQVQAGLGERDYIPLFIAIFVDLCILLVSINRPVNRLQGLVSAAREASNAEVHQVLDHFHRVHQGKRSERLDIFHDVMFDNNWGDQLIAVPLDIKPDDGSEEYQDKLIKSRYLSTLLVALEETGLVARKPMFRAASIKKQLSKIDSPYAQSESFRVYRFSKGAWSAIVLDDVLGASAKFKGRISDNDRYAAIDHMFDTFHQDSPNQQNEPNFDDDIRSPDLQSDATPDLNEDREPDRTGFTARDDRPEPVFEEQTSFTEAIITDDAAEIHAVKMVDREEGTFTKPPELPEDDTGNHETEIKTTLRNEQNSDKKRFSLVESKSSPTKSVDRISSDAETEVIILDSKVTMEPSGSANGVNGRDSQSGDHTDTLGSIDLEPDIQPGKEFLQGNRYLATEPEDAEFESIEDPEVIPNQQVVRFPRINDQDRKVENTAPSLGGKFELHLELDVNDNSVPQLKGNTLTSKLEQDILDHGDDVEWQRPEEIEIFQDQDELEYEWDQPDIESKKIAARFAAKNEKS